MNPYHAALSTNLKSLLGEIPRVRDGNADAIHDARVATRRLRAVVPLALRGHDAPRVEPLLIVFRDLGRMLGKARDLDIALDQALAVELRVPSAAALLGTLRTDLVARQAMRRRRLVKGLDSIPWAELERLTDEVASRPLFSDHDAAKRAIAGQAGRLREAIVAAAGVYMPNRAHAVRIEMKKLRYLLEPIGERGNTRSWVKQLKRTQEVLGTIQDKQALLDRVEQVPGFATERRAIVALTEQDCRELFGLYVQQRESTLRVCEEAKWVPSRARRTAHVAAAIGMVVPSVWWLLRPQLRSVRIPNAGGRSPADPRVEKTPRPVPETDLVLSR